jgi:hypothetical protein
MEHSATIPLPDALQFQIKISHQGKFDGLWYQSWGHQNNKIVQSSTAS